MQELFLIGVLCLLIFGPDRMTSMARDAGRFVSQARDSIEDFKSEIDLDSGLEDEEFEDLEEDEDEAEWFEQGESENPATPGEGHTRDYDQQSPRSDQGADGELKEVSFEK